MTETPLHAFSAYGIELEYMIVDEASLAVRPIADRLLVDEDGEITGQVERDGLAWSNELVLHQIEIKNPRPSADLASLARGLQHEVRTINRRLEALGARLMPGGAHPWMEPGSETRIWPHDNADIYQAYDRIFGCRRHGFANLQSMHLNLPFADEAEFVRLHAAVRVLLPILPALAASSPILDGAPTDWLDARMEAYRTLQAQLPASMGEVVPETVSGRVDYRERILEPMYQEAAPFDPQGLLRQEWLNARGAIPRFERDAIEIRVIDMQECPLADLAVAAAVNAALCPLYREEWTDLERQQAIDTGALAAILGRCSRQAERTVIEDPEYLQLFGWDDGPVSAGTLWRRLIRSARPDPAWEAPLKVMLEQGPLARRILAAVGHDAGRSRLEAVYRRLCDCLAVGTMFEP